MEVIPAIDLIDGRCVRLVQGQYDQKQVFSNEPVKMALYWQEKGAKRLHVVDLDGAKSGQPENMDVISEIVGNLDIPVQVGGGIRNENIIKKYLNLGVERVILGTAALEKPQLVKKMIEEYGPDQIVVGVDARSGKIAVKGWLEASEKTTVDVIKEMVKNGVRIFIYTDISRDGMLTGPDIEGTGNLLKFSGVKIIASGGVSTYSDLEKLAAAGIQSVIVGKALYTENLKPDFHEFEKI